MIVTTESGTQYEFNGKGQVRRCTYTGGGELRRDEEWLNFIFQWPPCVGFPMVLHLEPLGEGNVTIRTTSPVTRIDNPARIFMVPVDNNFVDPARPTVAELESMTEVKGITWNGLG